LSGEPRNQIDADVVEVTISQEPDIAKYVAAAMQPAGVPQVFVTKRLHAQADAIHARNLILIELRVAQRTGVYFNADFRRTLWKSSDDLRDELAVDDRWSAAAKKYRLRLFIKLRQFDFAQKAPNIRGVCVFAGYRYCKCAVVTALFTEWNVHVYAGFHKW
jgi:hypothetical protein